MALALLAQASVVAAPPPPPTSSPIVVTAPAFPDIAPIHDAVQACDRDAMARMGRDEPHRRAEFSASIYAEQRAIAADRAARAPVATTAAGKATLENARAMIDARQKRLDDAKLTEQAWRTAVEELRADFLANCGKRD